MIYLLLLYSCVNLVSANPLAKLLLQSRPNCNQNGYSSYNVPLQANNQPYVSHFTSQNPMTACSNTQQFGHQNGLPVQIQLDDPNQSYLNKILSNPMLQNIINRNNNNCNQNRKDIALQPNPEPTPHIVNNYYIIPPECLQGKDDGIEIVKKLIGDQAVVCQNDEISNQKHTENERKNMQRSHNTQNEEKRRPKSNKRPQNQEHGHIRKQNNNNPQKRKRKNGPQNQNRGNQNKNNQNMNKNVHNKNNEPVKIIDERNLPHKRNGTQVSQPQKNGKKRRKRPNKKSENENINNNEQTSNETISSKNDTVLNDKEPHQKIRRKYKESSENNKDEEVIRDIHEKFPGIPEDVIRRLLRYLRKQLQKSCESVQPSDSKIKSNQNHNTKSDNKRRRNKQRNQNKRRKSKNNTDLVEVTESPPTVTTDNSLITATQSETTTEVFNNQVDDSKTQNNKNEYTTQHKIETEVVETTTYTDTQTPKLGEEDKILDLENNVDDYFPDFRFDKMYMSEDDYIRSLRDNRFYYTTDRNYNSENENNNEESREIYYEPYETTKSRKDNYEFQSREIEDTLIRPDKDNFDNDDEVVSKDYSREELEFQTPPILEYPDFVTKPIIKYFDVEGPIYKPEYKKVDNINDKLSTYSDVKSITTPFKDKPKNDNIETVFAKSKVAKYGQLEEIEEDTMIKNDHPKFDDTVLVYAKSFPDS